MFPVKTGGAEKLKFKSPRLTANSALFVSVGVGVGYAPSLTTAIKSNAII
jgi:hypothetical protein